MRYRNKKSGRYQRDYRLLGYFFASAGVIGSLIMMFLGVNTIVKAIENKFASLGKVIIVENVNADITWQEQVKQTLKDFGVDEVKAEKIIQCESRWDMYAIHANKDGSIDVGLWQWNNKIHPEVSRFCALDSQCSTVNAIRVIKTRGFGEWVCSKYVR